MLLHDLLSFRVRSDQSVPNYDLQCVISSSTSYDASFCGSSHLTVPAQSFHFAISFVLMLDFCCNNFFGPSYPLSLLQICVSIQPTSRSLPLSLTSHFLGLLGLHRSRHNGERLALFEITLWLYEDQPPTILYFLASWNQ